MTETKLRAHDLEATPIPQGLGLWWAGYYGQIPPGWVVDSAACDGRFPKSVANLTDPVAQTGGSNTHNHALPAHTHTVSASPSGSYQAWQGSGTAMLGYSHTHADADSQAGATTGTDAPVPSYLEVVPIKFNQSAGGTGKGLPRLHDFAASALLPHKIIGYWRSDSAVPPGFAKCDGSTVNNVVTPNLRGKYLKGIPNGGTTPGGNAGNTTHTHNGSHYHSAGSFTSGLRSGYSESDPANVLRSSQNYHTFNTTALTTGGPSNSNDPAYSTLHYLCFVGYGASSHAHPSGSLRLGDLDPSLLLPRGVVGAWAFADAIPSGFRHCDNLSWDNGVPAGYAVDSRRPDGYDRLLKHVPSATTNGGTTGGTSAHGHSSVNHGHTSGNPTNAWARGHYGSNPGYDDDVAVYPHTHATSNTTFSNLGDGVSHVPSSVEVAWIVKD